MKNILLIIIFTTYYVVAAFSSPRDANNIPQCDLKKSKENINNILSSIHNNKIDTDINSFVNIASDQSDILIVGEAHQELLPKLAIYNNLNSLLQNNYGVLAVEMLNKSAQNHLNDFCKGKLTRNQFLPIWESHWHYKDQTKNYLDLVKKACDLGMKVYAVDERDNNELLAKPKNEENNWRNRKMAENIINIHKKHKNKIVFLTGSIHAFTSPISNASAALQDFTGNTSVSIELKKHPYQINITSINIKSSFPITDTEQLCSDHDPIEDLTKKYSKQNNVLFKGSPLIPFDYIYIKYN